MATERCPKCGTTDVKWPDHQCPDPINLMERLTRVWYSYYFGADLYPAMGGEPLPLATRQGLAMRAVAVIDGDDAVESQRAAIIKAERWHL